MCTVLLILPCIPVGDLMFTGQYWPAVSLNSLHTHRRTFLFYNAFPKENAFGHRILTELKIFFHRRNYSRTSHVTFTESV